MHWEDILIEEAKRRRKIFENLNLYLDKIKEVIKSMDKDAKIYLFGSVPENRYLYMSDIDILIVTNISPALVLSELWKNGIKDPFEIHVASPEEYRRYWRRVKLYEIK